MTLEEASAYLRAGRQVLKKLCREGRIPATKIGKSWRFSGEELREWLAIPNAWCVWTAEELSAWRKKRVAGEPKV